MAELIPPPAAKSASSAVEILRAWAIDGTLHCTLSPDAWDDARTWGIVLADVARHIANAVSEREGIDAESVLADISRLFNVELDSPTDDPSGYFVNEGE